MIDIKKNSNIARLKANLDIDFFYKWLSFLTPLHKLTKTEMKVLASFLNKRFELLSVVSDEHLLNNLLKSAAIKKEVREAIDMDVGQFNIMVSKLKRSGILKNDIIENHYIPRIEKNAEQYRLILVFDINNDKISLPK